jgi:cobalt-zinc-cadmium efflux system outer membrane protein
MKKARRITFEYAPEYANASSTLMRFSGRNDMPKLRIKQSNRRDGYMFVPNRSCASLKVIKFLLLTGVVVGAAISSAADLHARERSADTSSSTTRSVSASERIAAADLISTSSLPAFTDAQSSGVVSTALNPSSSDIVSLDSTDTGTVESSLRASLFWGEVGDPNGYSLQQLLSMAAKANPNWGTYAANHAAAHAELIGACVFPNPEVEVEVGKETARKGGDSARTYALSFSQPIEMPGKRLARQVEAQAGFAVVAGETLEFESMLRGDVAEAYWTVQYHDALQRLWQTLLDVASRLEDIAKARVELGESGNIELVNANVEVLRAKRERDAARRRMIGAKAALNALVGGCLGTNFRLSQGFPESPKTIELRNSSTSAMACHPRLQRLAAELEQRYATIDKERTAWWPDLRLGARTEHALDSNSAAITAGIEVPLFNRNQGGIAKAQAQAQKTYNDIAIAFNELRRDVEVAYQNYELAREQIATYNDGLKQASEQAVSLAYVSYRAGATGYLDVLTARRLLQETEQGYIQALYDAATAKARLDKATGKLIRSRSREKTQTVRTEEMKVSK